VVSEDCRSRSRPLLPSKRGDSGGSNRSRVNGLGEGGRTIKGDYGIVLSQTRVLTTRNKNLITCGKKEKEEEKDDK